MSAFVCSQWALWSSQINHVLWRWAASLWAFFPFVSLFLGSRISCYYYYYYYFQTDVCCHPGISRGECFKGRKKKRKDTRFYCTTNVTRKRNSVTLVQEGKTLKSTVTKNTVTLTFIFVYCHLAVKWSRYIKYFNKIFCHNKMTMFFVSFPTTRKKW